MIVATTITGCQEPTSTPPSVSAIDTSGVSTSGTLRLDGEIISIPSPILISTVLQKNKIEYNEKLLHNLQNRNKYVNEVKKAINLGVYGCDLAYLANYDLGQVNVDYFDAVASLASDLEILDKIDKNILSKFQNNLSHKDSLLALNAEFFRTADLYLKSSERSHLSNLILIGGWVESLHFAFDAATHNEEIRKRIAEQKYSATSIRNLSSKITDQSYASIQTALDKLCTEFEKLTSTYIYRQPINDQREKKTYLRSQTSVKLDEESFNTIKQQLEIVRNLIIE